MRFLLPFVDASAARRRARKNINRVPSARFFAILRANRRFLVIIDNLRSFFLSFPLRAITDLQVD
jgi:hypothetical protein